MHNFGNMLLYIYWQSLCKNRKTEMIYICLFIYITLLKKEEKHGFLI